MGLTLSVAVPSDEESEDGACDDVGRVVAVVHAPADRDEDRPADGDEQDPRLDAQPALVVDLHLARQVERQVDEPAERARRVARRERPEPILNKERSKEPGQTAARLTQAKGRTYIEQIRASADLPGRERVGRRVGQARGRLASILRTRQGDGRVRTMRTYGEGSSDGGCAYEEVWSGSADANLDDVCRRARHSQRQDAENVAPGGGFQVGQLCSFRRSVHT